MLLRVGVTVNIPSGVQVAPGLIEASDDTSGGGSRCCMTTKEHEVQETDPGLPNMLS